MVGGNRKVLLLMVLLCTAAGVAVAVEHPLLRLGLGAAILTALVFALAPVRETALLVWLFLAPFWQEVARTTEFGTGLNNVGYLVAGGGVVLWAAVVMVERIRNRDTTMLELAPLLFAVLAALSLAFSELIPVGWTKVDFVRQVYGNVVLGVAGYYLMAYGVGRSFVDRLFSALWLSSLGVSALAVIEHFTGWQLWSYELWLYVDIGRAVGPLANPAVLGTFCGIVTVSSAAYLMWSREDRYLTRLALMALVLALPALWFSYARASWLAVVVAIALVAALKSEYRYTLALVATAAALAVALVWGTVGESAVVTERIGNVSNAQVRVLLTAWSLELAAQKPLLGWGYGSFDAAKTLATSSIADIPTSFAVNDTSHNTFLTYLVELGLVGVTLLLLAWVPPLQRGIRTLLGRQSMDWRLFACVGALIVFIVNATFIDMRFFSYPVLLAWMLLGALRNLTVDPVLLDVGVPLPPGEDE